MPRNRVEELESTVRELESTVEGLTEELVESKERIRVLEELLDAEPTTRVPERRPIETRDADRGEAASAKADGGQVEIGGDDDDVVETSEEDEPQESRTDDIIVA